MAPSTDRTDDESMTQTAIGSSNEARATAATLVSRVLVGCVECLEAKDSEDASLNQIENILESFWFSQSHHKGEEFKLLPL